MRYSALTVRIDADIAESVIRLGDYVNATARSDFIGKIYSVLLTAIIIEDTAEPFDAMSRLIQMYVSDDIFGIPGESKPYRQMESALSEYSAVSHKFFERYVRKDSLVMSLVDLIRSDDFSYPEELFDVTFSRNGRYILVRRG